MIVNAVLLAMREIRRNMMRAILTTLGIVIGVGAVITLVTIGNGASASVTLPTGAHGIDGTGHTVMPGIVGLHDHMYYGSPVGGSMRPMLYSYPRLFLMIVRMSADPAAT